MNVPKITHDHVSSFDHEGPITEHGIHRFFTEASELGLPPGKWPTWFETELGNGLRLNLTRVNEEAAVYHQTGGCIELTVFND